MLNNDGLKKNREIERDRVFFIFNMVNECVIYKNMGLWAKVQGYGNEKPPVSVFTFSDMLHRDMKNRQ